MAYVPPHLLLITSSESRSGLDKSLKKGGAGAHSWGDILEDPSLYPVDDDGVAEDNITSSGTQDTPEPRISVSTKGVQAIQARKQTLGDGALGEAEDEPSPDSPSVETVGFPSPKVSRARSGSLSVSYTDEDLALAKRFRTRVFSGGSGEGFIHAP
jgi:hypothetical protein